MVTFELHVDCEQLQNSMYAISAAYNWLADCTWTKAAGQLICQLRKKVSWHCWASWDSLLQGTTVSCRAIVTCKWQPKVPDDGRASWDKNNCPGQYIAGHGKMFMPLLSIFTLKLLPRQNEVFDITAPSLAGQLTVTFPSLSSFSSPILSPILLTSAGRASMLLALSYAQLPEGDSIQIAAK